MTPNSIQHGFVFLVLCLAALACGDGSSGPQGPITVVDLTGDGGVGGGCVQPGFPSDQPNLFIVPPPRFLLTTPQAQQSTTGQAIVDPGDPIEAEIAVNAATRRVLVELVDVSEPLRVIYTDEVETPGNQTIDLLLFTSPQDFGRYFMRLTLCGFDCDEVEVVFDLVECPDQPIVSGPCGVNVPYKRTVFEGGDLVQEDNTCIDLGGQPGVGSGTILIQ